MEHLIFDEICSGFHFGLGGAQKRYKVVPDLACFGKAMANGLPISCIVGRAEIMKIFEEINSKGATVIVATHNKEIMKKMGKRVIALDKGRIVSDALA